MHSLLQSSGAMLFPLLVTALLSLNRVCLSFQLSVFPVRSSSVELDAAPAVSESFDLSSGLISQLAVAAIRARLRAHTSVKCEVAAKNNGLLVGSFFVGPATVKGRGWQSGLGLTCRAIEATVAVCELDKRQVVAEKRLVLKQASFGDAMVALDKNDFSNFLAHPLLRPPNVPAANDESAENVNNLQFLRDEIMIDPEMKTVTFYVQSDDKKWRCILRRTDNAARRARVDVSPIKDSDGDDSKVAALAAQLGDKLTRYFNDIVFELDGTFLTFRDMRVTNKGASPSVILKMGIRVEKFPSRNLAF